MIDKEFEKKLERFANAINGKVLESGGSNLVPYGSYKVLFENGEILLLFGEPLRGGIRVTHETRINFFLRDNCNVKLKAQTSDLLSKLTMTGRQKFGVDELDGAYLFKSDSPGLAFQLADAFKEFHQQEKHKHFFMETDVISDQKVLSIFVPEVVISKIYSLFWLGRKIAQSMSG